jgi:hypothetical protein
MPREQEPRFEAPAKREEKVGEKTKAAQFPAIDCSFPHVCVHLFFVARPGGLVAVGVFTSVAVVTAIAAVQWAKEVRIPPSSPCPAA